MGASEGLLWWSTVHRAAPTRAGKAWGCSSLRLPLQAEQAAYALELHACSLTPPAAPPGSPARPQGLTWLYMTTPVTVTA